MGYPKHPSNIEHAHPKVGSMSIVGHTTATNTRIWVRVYTEGKWWLVVSRSRLTGDLDSLEEMDVDEFMNEKDIFTAFCKPKLINNKSGLTTTFDVEGLEPDTQYYYALIADKMHLETIPRRTEIGYQEIKYFRTQPKDPNEITFGFYSCHDPFSNRTHSEGAWPIYQDVLREKKALFSIGGGDQIYIDTNTKDDMQDVWVWLAAYKKKIINDFRLENGSLDRNALTDYFTQIYQNYYRTYWNFSNQKQVYSSVPQYMIWDDHEIMDGWGSYTKKERRHLLNKLFQDDDETVNDEIIKLMFEAAKKAYFQFEHSHNPKTHIDWAPENNAKCEWDYSFYIGDFGFYILDMRGHHNFERHEEGNALLGDEQMQRLNDWLTNPKSRKLKTVFIVSTVPIVHWGPVATNLDIGSMKDDIRDEWEHESNHKEREKLLDKIFNFSQTNKCPVMFLSGDVHCASIYSIEDEDFSKAMVFNATSSAISRKPAPEKAEWFMKKTGMLKGYKDGKKASVKRHYALSGHYNFMTVTASIVDHKPSLTVNLCWPGGDEDEYIQKRMVLL